MMNNIIFSICAKNYIGLTQVLEKSILAHNNDVDFYIIVADELDGLQKEDLPNNVLCAKSILSFSDEEWYDYAFKYDLTEFCTLLKPFCFNYFFDWYGADCKVVYFDPDIFVFNSLSKIWETLNSKDICLTPHITTSEVKYSGDLSERNLLSSGLYNCGFIAVKNGEFGKDFINFWGERLRNSCFRIESESMFTDQKWVDFVPSLYPSSSYEIFFDLGLNIAPWNFYEREILVVNGILKCRNCIRQDDQIFDVMFVHFSGFNYLSLLDNNVIQQNILGQKYREDLQILFDTYAKALVCSSFKDYTQFSYKYNYFTTGEPISSFHRRLYRRLLSDHKILNDNPFDNGEFYKNCKDHKLVKNCNFDKSAKSFSSDLSKLSRKISIINYIFYLLFKAIGINRYVMLLKLLRMYSKYENNAFVYDKSYLKFIGFHK